MCSTSKALHCFGNALLGNLQLCQVGGFSCQSSQPYFIAGSANLDHTLADVYGLNAPGRTPTCDKLKKIPLPLVHISLIRIVVFKRVSRLMPKWTMPKHSSIDLSPIYHDFVAIGEGLDDLFSPNPRHFVLVAEKDIRHMRPKAFIIHIILSKPFFVVDIRTISSA